MPRVYLPSSNVFFIVRLVSFTNSSRDHSNIDIRGGSFRSIQVIHGAGIAIGVYNQKMLWIWTTILQEKNVVVCHPRRKKDMPDAKLGTWVSEEIDLPILYSVP